MGRFGSLLTAISRPGSLRLLPIGYQAGKSASAQILGQGLKM
jgi:hypothetical protein